MSDVLTTLNENPELAGWIVALFVLAILRDVIGWVARRLWQMWEHRHGNGMQGMLKANTKALIEVKAALQAAADIDPPPYPQCHYDPLHFDRVAETHRLVKGIHQLQEWQRDSIHEGRFHCKLSDEAVRAIERLKP